jgi:hypothetical protein
MTTNESITALKDEFWDKHKVTVKTTNESITVLKEMWDTHKVMIKSNESYALSIAAMKKMWEERKALEFQNDMKKITDGIASAISNKTKWFRVDIVCDEVLNIVSRDFDVQYINVSDYCSFEREIRYTKCDRADAKKLQLVFKTP